jgi:SAM-dependent methyltransferase
MNETVQALYRESAAGVRATFAGADRAQAFEYYAPLLEFVSGINPPPARLLDVGCGSGWSTFTFANAGYNATGVDLNPAAFEPPPHDRCKLIAGSATDIPFAPQSFDLVVCYQCLEHVSAPRQALDEMMRACRPGGIIAIVGPNLVSPFPGLAYLAHPSSWRTVGFIRRPRMPRHPYGNTVPEILAVALLRTAQLAGKLIRRSPRFTMREPDSVPPFHADNDACYLCNPTDLISYLKGRGCRIERRGRPGRPPLTHVFAGGTWVAARKPTSNDSADKPAASANHSTILHQGKPMLDKTRV